MDQLIAGSSEAAASPTLQRKCIALICFQVWRPEQMI